MMTQQEKDDILMMKEVETYFLIDECGLFMWRMNHAMMRGDISDGEKPAIIEDVNNVRELQRFAVVNLTRFGVDPKTVTDRVNGDYWKWYKHWDDWKKNLPDKDWEIVSTGKYEGFLPLTNWKGEKL